MVGATAFMETLELALELRRANYGANGERLGLDLYPYTEDQVGAVRRSVLQWRFIDGVAGQIDEPALRECQQRKDAVARLRARVRGAGGVTAGAFIGIDVGTTAVKALAVSPSGEVLARARGGVPAQHAAPGLGRAGPRGLVARDAGGARRRSAVEPCRRSGCRGQMHGLVALDAADQVIRPAILWNDERTGAECEAIEQRSASSG